MSSIEGKVFLPKEVTLGEAKSALWWCKSYQIDLTNTENEYRESLVFDYYMKTEDSSQFIKAIKKLNGKILIVKL